MTNATVTVTFTNSDNSNAIVLTIADANPPIIEVTVNSGHPYTTQALDLNQTYSLQLRKQGVVKTAFLTVTSNHFGCDLNDLFNGTTPTPAKVTFINSDPSNAVTLSVKDDQGNTVVDDVSVTNSDPYVIDTLKLNALYSVHLEQEGASDQDISLTITSDPFTYDVYTPFLNNATVIFTNSDKSRSISLSVLDDKGVPFIKDVVVSPGNKPYVATLQLEETYKLLLVRGATQVESSVTINSDPFIYDVNTPFYAQVTFTHSDHSNDISLSVPDGKGGYLIQDVSVTNRQPYVTDVLDLNQTYTLRLTKGNESAQLSLTISSNPFLYDVNTPFYAQVTFTNSDQWKDISLSVPDGKGGYLIQNVSVTNSQPYVTDVLDLNQTYTLKLTKGNESAQLSAKISYNGYTVNVNTSFEGPVNVMFTNSSVYTTVSLSVVDGQGGYHIKDARISSTQAYATRILNLNATYFLELKVVEYGVSAQSSITINSNAFLYDVHKPFSSQVTFSNSNRQATLAFDAWASNNRKIIFNAGVNYDLPLTIDVLILYATYTLDLRRNGETRKKTLTITHTPFTYDLNSAF